MINGKVADFIDQLYYGQELLFLYKGKKFFIQGWFNKEGDEAVMALEEVSEAPFSGYIWEIRSKKMRECAEAFLAAPIWDGLNFRQIEKEVEWTDW